MGTASPVFSTVADRLVTSADDCALVRLLGHTQAARRLLDGHTAWGEVGALGLTGTRMDTLTLTNNEAAVLSTSKPQVQLLSDYAKDRWRFPCVLPGGARSPGMLVAVDSPKKHNPI